MQRYNKVLDISRGSGSLRSPVPVPKRIIWARPYQAPALEALCSYAYAPKTSACHSIHPTSLTSSIALADEELDKPQLNDLTVYTMRISTSYSRGSDLYDPNAVVYVCLVGPQGKSLIHTINQIYDPQATAALMRRLRGCGGSDAAASASSSGSGGQLRRRFRAGNVDEVCFLGPSLGVVCALLIGPSCGSWGLEEVSVATSSQPSTQRFVCREQLGRSPESSAAFLRMVPAGSKVIGTGASAKIICQDAADVLREVGLVEYERLKARLLLTTAVLTLGGTAITGMAGGQEVAACFAGGGAAGMLYLWLLQHSLEAMRLTGTAPASGAAGRAGALVLVAERGSAGQRQAIHSRSSWLRLEAEAATTGYQLLSRLLGSWKVRMLLLSGAGLAAVWGVHLFFQLYAERPEGLPAEQLAHWQRQSEAWALITALAGFLMYKAALLIVAIVPAPLPRATPAATPEKCEAE